MGSNFRQMNNRQTSICGCSDAFAIKNEAVCVKSLHLLKYENGTDDVGAVVWCLQKILTYVQKF